MDEQPTTALVVDDEPPIVWLTTTILERAGCHVISASSGDEALRIMSSDLFPDIVVTDLEMHPRTGWELIECMASDGRLKDIPVVIASACSKHQLITAPNVVARLYKPFDASQLVTTVTQAVNAARQLQRRRELALAAVALFRDKINVHRQRFGKPPLTDAVAARIESVLMSLAKDCQLVPMFEAFAHILELIEEL